MLPGYRTRLLSDLERWADEGLISAEAAATIRQRYPAQADGVLVALIYVSGILLSAGLIALVASNWQDIPRSVRVGGLLSLNLAIVAACAFLSQRRPPGSIAIEALAALSIVSAGASISLVGQMYHFPAKWPAFARAMVVIALATAVVARSTSALWLGAVALGWFMESLGIEGRLLATTRGSAWTPHSLETGIYCAALAVLALSPWIVRVGPSTLFLVLLPAVWWISLGPTSLNPDLMSMAPIPVIAISMLLLFQLGAKFLNPQRVRDAQSALVGVLVTVIVMSAVDDSLTALNGGMRGSPVLMSLGLVAACLLLITGRLSAGLWSDPRFWLAIALAASCGIGFNIAVKGNLTVLRWLLPLAALAVEARLSDRGKTFAAIVVAFLGLIAFQMGVVGDLRTFAMVLLGGGAVAVAVLMAVRKIGGVAAHGNPP
jgi:uncharacterized membrane protein